MACGQHSLWGLIFSIARETGWHWNEVLWKVSWVNIRVMLADAPGYKKQPEVKKQLETEEDFKAFLKL